MAFEVNTYSPSDVILDLSGYRVQGFEMIESTRNSPAFQIVRGIRGTATRVRNRDTSCSIRVGIIQTSLANDVLSELISRDLETNSVRLSLNLTDQLGSSKISSSNAFISGHAPVRFGDSIEYRIWEIICLTTDLYVVGGNARHKGSLFDSLGGFSQNLQDQFNNLFDRASNAFQNFNG